MKITHAGSGPSTPGPAEYFSGRVRRDPLVDAETPGRVTTALVTFELGARTAWHSHPAGQVLLVVAGRGWAQSEGGPRREIAPGDSVWFAAGEKHWHGATATTAMSHVAVTEQVEGVTATWMEHVSDEDYAG